MTDNDKPLEVGIRPMTPEERRRSIEREKANNFIATCVSCGGPSKNIFCGFCLEEE
jgi:hypothetical protein